MSLYLRDTQISVYIYHNELKIIAIAYYFFATLDTKFALTRYVLIVVT